MKKPTRQELETLLQKRTTECDQLRCFLYDLINGKALRSTIGDSTWLISRPASPDTGIAVTFFKREDTQGTYWGLDSVGTIETVKRETDCMHAHSFNFTQPSKEQAHNKWLLADAARSVHVMALDEGCSGTQVPTKHRFGFEPITIK